MPWYRHLQRLNNEKRKDIPSQEPKALRPQRRCSGCTGENDAVVPVALGERLYGLIQAPKRFVRIARAGHDDLGARAVAAAKQFIAEQ